LEKLVWKLEVPVSWREDCDFLEHVFLGLLVCLSEDAPKVAHLLSKQNLQLDFPSFPIFPDFPIYPWGREMVSWEGVEYPPG